MTEQHWTKDERAKVFFTIAEGLGIEEPLACLGVEDLAQYRGTMSEAIALLNADAHAIQLQEQLFEQSTQLPEAMVTANATFRTNNGGVWQVTIRPIAQSDIVVAAMKNLATSIGVWELAVCKGRKWEPIQRYSQVPANNGGSGSTGQNGSGRSGPGPGRSSTGRGGSDLAGLYIKRGAGEIVELTCRDGVLEYDVKGRQFTMKDSRGLETALSIWSDDCWTDRFTPESLEGKQILDRGAFGQVLVAEYGKNKDTGYWDVLSVHPER